MFISFSFDHGSLEPDHGLYVDSCFDILIGKVHMISVSVADGIGIFAVVVDQADVVLCFRIENPIGGIGNVPSAIGIEFRPGMEALRALTVSGASVTPYELCGDMARPAKGCK